MHSVRSSSCFSAILPLVPRSFLLVYVPHSIEFDCSNVPRKWTDANIRFHAIFQLIIVIISLSSSLPSPILLPLVLQQRRAGNSLAQSVFSPVNFTPFLIPFRFQFFHSFIFAISPLCCWHQTLCFSSDGRIVARFNSTWFFSTNSFIPDRYKRACFSFNVCIQTNTIGTSKVPIFLHSPCLHFFALHCYVIFNMLESDLAPNFIWICMQHHSCSFSVLLCEYLILF